ncbi:hypothetical protein C7999DRAFT_31492 [Corynascus novoguineensis]|uniref:Uncharacterized protein n=1 Tax=Corynascus novoguineensis TaxID=1126955 RepID=A0AAN7HPN7_9PEZI|nr:hypothetical protein C7999DRAFT_31492 [Corynascus novoguineensis]
MSQKARYMVQCSEASSWSELDIDETFPESQLDFARAKCDALLGAIEQSSTKSIFQPETRELVTQPTAADIKVEKQQHEPQPAGTTTSQPGLAIPKPRTFSVISNLTLSFSRGSTGSQQSSRNVNQESHGTITSIHNRATIRPSLHQQNISGQKQSSDPRKMPPSSSHPNDPKAITTAMPPQYWAGRFMAMRDRFHNEVLEPAHLAQVCKARPTKPLRDLTCQATAASGNDFSASVYANPRTVQAGKYTSTLNNLSPQPSRSRISLSATSCAILQSTLYNTKSSPPSYTQAVRSFSNSSTTTVHTPYSTRRGSRPLPATDENSVPGLSLATVPSDENNNNGTAVVTSASLHEETNASPGNDSNTVSLAVASAATAGRDGEDETSLREGRVFAHLHDLCVTDAARASLRQWQAAYARKTGNENLMPAALDMNQATQTNPDTRRVTGGSVTKGSDCGSESSWRRRYTHVHGGVAGWSEELKGKTDANEKMWASQSQTRKVPTSGEEQATCSNGNGRDDGDESASVGNLEVSFTGTGIEHAASLGHGREFGRRGMEMVRRLKRSLVGGGSEEKFGRDEERKSGGDGYGDAVVADSDLADQKILAVTERGKERKEERKGERKGERRFSFF